MVEAIPTATRYRYPISTEDLGRLLVHEAKFLGDGTLVRVLAKVPGVSQVSYDIVDSEGNIFFTLENTAPDSALNEITETIATFLKDIA